MDANKKGRPELKIKILLKARLQATEGGDTTLFYAFICKKPSTDVSDEVTFSPSHLLWKDEMRLKP